MHVQGRCLSLPVSGMLGIQSLVVWRVHTQIVFYFYTFCLGCCVFFCILAKLHIGRCSVHSMGYAGLDFSRLGLVTCIRMIIM